MPGWFDMRRSGAALWAFMAARTSAVIVIP
jgi:hypothetical protein